METEYSLQKLLQFIQYAGEKGLVNSKTARNWRSATTQLLKNLSADAEADVRLIDVEAELRGIINQGTNSMSPDTMRTYVTRVENAIQQFVSWRNDPVSYKPQSTNRGRANSDGKTPSTNKSGRSSSANSQKVQLDATTTTAATVSSSNNEEVEHSVKTLTLPFPLRPDFLAKVVIPRDLTTDEARRLGAFLMTLAIDYSPSSSQSIQ